LQADQESETASFAALKEKLFQPVYPGAPMLLVQVGACHDAGGAARVVQALEAFINS
jgi:hypothetical protein